MRGGKREDIAGLARFLDHEAEHWERIRPAREAISRIHSLVEAEAEAKIALESAQADLAWVKAQAARLGTLLPQAKDAAWREIKALRHDFELSLQKERLLRVEEERWLDARLAEKRALFERLIQQIEALRAQLSENLPQ